MESQQDVTIKNWDGTWTYHPQVKARPESVEDLIEIVTDKVRFPSPVRPAGSMHSTARMNGDDEGGTMVDMTAMNRILHFTDDTVTVEAGVTHGDLAKALKARGLQPYITTEIGNTTLA
ncbi:MAG: FAD-dependent oxidoreductase, partial [Pseudomonadota bacterium]